MELEFLSTFLSGPFSFEPGEWFQNRQPLLAHSSSFPRARVPWKQVLCLLLCWLCLDPILLAGVETILVDDG